MLDVLIESMGYAMQPGDVYWCTADCGWVTGHTYLTYGPLLAGATNVLFGSTPMYPTIDRVWQVIARYKVCATFLSPITSLAYPSTQRRVCCLGDYTLADIAHNPTQGIGQKDHTSSRQTMRILFVPFRLDKHKLAT